MKHSLLNASRRQWAAGIRLSKLGTWSLSGVWNLGFGIFCLGLVLSASISAYAQPSSNSAARYETRSVHDPNGIGKFFMGREIAHVMGHDNGGAEWLER